MLAIRRRRFVCIHLIRVYSRIREQCRPVAGSLLGSGTPWVRAEDVQESTVCCTTTATSPRSVHWHGRCTNDTWRHFVVVVVTMAMGVLCANARVVSQVQLNEMVFAAN